MTAAIAVGETLAAAVVAVMYAGGAVLEAYAEGRARREMHALLARQPRHATRRRGARLEEVALDAIIPGDTLLIRRGETLPVDGRVRGPARLDTAALTGESVPRTLAAGEEALSGSINAGAAFDLAATRPAAESTYAGIARGARRIAVQSVVAGIGLSILGMIAAALGWLTPLQGAIMQEGIDVAVILNALRALRIDPGRA